MQTFFVLSNKDMANNREGADNYGNGSVVIVTKEGSMQGLKAKVQDDNWKGLVKVEMLEGVDKGKVKSYSRQHLAAIMMKYATPNNTPSADDSSGDPEPLKKALVRYNSKKDINIFSLTEEQQQAGVSFLKGDELDHMTNEAHEIAVFQLNERVMIVKTGTQRGKVAKVIDPNWNGMVKVCMAKNTDQVKSYTKDELTQMWPFLLRFRSTNFGVPLGIAAQASLWFVLSTSSGGFQEAEYVSTALWCVALALWTLAVLVYGAKCWFFFNLGVARELAHPIRLNFFYTLFVTLYLLVGSMPGFVSDRVSSDAMRWFLVGVGALQVAAEVDTYSRWIFTEDLDLQASTPSQANCNTAP